MWQPGVAVGGGDLPGSEIKAVDTFMDETIAAAHSQLESHGLGDVKLSWERPHSRVVWYGANLVILVGEPLSGGFATKVYADARNQPSADLQTIVALVKRDVGFRNPFWLAIPLEYINAIGDARGVAIKAIARELVEDIIRQHEFISKLGISDAVTYLNNAKRRLDEGTREAMADVKTNCRNAIEGLVLHLTGTSNFSKAGKILLGKGVFTEHEANFVQALAALIDALFDVASRPGGHPPLPTREDATFVLQVTEATVNYIAGRALASGIRP